MRFLLYWCLYYSGAIGFILFCLRRIRRRHDALVIMYHRVMAPDAQPYFDKGPSVHRPAGDFAAEVAFLSRWFRIVSPDELAESLKIGAAFSEPSVMITFY